MLDHYEVVHCKVAWQGYEGPHTQRAGRTLPEPELRARATQHLQQYIDHCTVSDREMPHVMALARSVQPVTHWEEHVTTMETEDTDIPSYVGEVHGSFILHGRRRVLCWYRLEYEADANTSTVVSELVACPMSNHTHHSQVC